jgi:stage II sporulation protein D
LFFIASSTVSAAPDYFSEYKDNIRVALLDTDLSNTTSLDFVLKGDYIIEGMNTVISDGTYCLKLESGIMTLYKNGLLVSQFVNGANVTLSSQNSSSNLLTITKTKKQYLGSFYFVNKGTYISIVNKLGIDQYLYGVVPSEISESSQVEALKAQAVAARTYAFSKMLTPASTDYDLGNNSNFQVYNGYSTLTPRCTAAVDATKGFIVTNNGLPINAYFYSSNGGYTEKVENVWGSTPLPYSDSVPDTYDSMDSWTRSYTSAEINSRLSSTYKTTIGDFTGIDLNSITRYPSGRISNITINGTKGSISFSKNNARFFLAVGNIDTDLKSAMYEVTYDSQSDTYTFKGKGFGHGVGMSQCGAQNRASAGYKFSDILSFYYPNTKLDNYFVSVQGITPSAPSVNVGDSVNFTTNASGGNQLLYQYNVYNYQTKLWTTATSYTSNSSFNWKFTDPGKYQVMCFVKDLNSSNTYDGVAYSEVTANLVPVTLNSITPSQLTTYKGKQETFTVSASGGSSLLYQFNVYNYQTKLWTAATSYTSTPALNWSFADTGKYQVMCFVKDSSSTKQYDVVAYSEVTVGTQQVTLNGITPSQLTTYKGKQETFTVSASGGSSLLYQFNVYNYQTKLWTAATSYTSTPALNWTFSDAGRYQVMCFVKDSSSTKQYDVVAYSEVTVGTQPVTLNGITPSQLTTYKGKQETFTVSASGGSSLLYQFNVYNYQTKLWTAATSYNSNPALNWTFADTGRYQVMCFVKDSSSTKQYDVVAYSEVTVGTQPVTLNGITPSQLTTYKGKQETFTVSASGGSSLLYQFNIYNYQTKLWTAATSYTSNPALNWTFADTGKYQIMCFVKDSSSTKQYDVVAYSEVTVGTQPVTLNGITPSQLTTYKGKQETFTVSASGGSSLLYQFNVYNYQTKLWTAATNYTSTPALKWTFNETGKYQVMCFVKDSSSANQYDVVAYSEVTVNSPVTLNGMTPSQLTTTVGQQKTFSVSASGGTSLLYRYYVYDYQSQTWTTATDYCTSPSLSWSFKSKGRYQVMCFVKDKTSSNTYDKAAYSEVTVNDIVTTCAMSASAPVELATIKGKIETFTYKDATTSSTLLYQFNVYDYSTQTWTMVQDYGTSNSLSRSFSSGGRYQVMCFVKDKTSTKQYDKVAYCEVMVANAAVSGSYTVVLDAGHGGDDSGAIGVTGVYEKNVNLPVVLKTGALLEAAGVNVVYTRTTDATTSLQARCDAANNSGATYLVSVHSNAMDNLPSVNGIETLYDTTDPESLKLATAIQNALIKEVGSVDRGLKDGNWLWLVNHTNPPCSVVLTELGFLTNPTEESLLISNQYQNRCALAISNAIVSCLNSKN